MSLLPDPLESALQALIHAMQQGLADAASKSPLPVVSRRFEQSGVHVYYRCVHGSAVGARFVASGLPPPQLRTLRRAVVVADIALADHWQGRGFFKSLVARLSEPRQEIDLIEVENVVSEGLVAHLARAGWLSRNGMAVGGCWVIVPAFQIGTNSHSEGETQPRHN